MARDRRGGGEINSSSMADIAFLLLIFFLVTTQIADDKGLTLQLPPPPEDIEQVDIKIQERNIFKVLVNAQDRLLIEGELVTDVTKIKDMVKEHVLNNGKDPSKSDSPADAVVSFKTNRGTSYEMYISVLDQIQGAYYEMYAERVGITPQEWRDLDTKDPEDKRLYDKGRGRQPDGKLEFPMAISIAEPDKTGGN